MWMMARVQGPGVMIFAPGGVQRKNFNDFDSAVVALLKEGWEPFAADSGNAVMVWLRKPAV